MSERVLPAPYAGTGPGRLELRALLDLAARQAASADAQGRLDASVLRALRASGALNLALPACYGGPELDPVDAFDVIASLAKADATTAWYAAVASGGATAAWTLPAASVRQIWAEGNGTIVGGSLRPGGIGTATEQGVLIESGSWFWGSAGIDASWMLGAIEVKDRGPHVVFLSADAFEVELTWQAVGLRASASHAFHARPGTLVPWHLVVDKGSPAVPGCAARLAKCSATSYLCVLFAAIAIGNAEGALEQITALAQDKIPTGETAALATSPHAWRELASATLRLQSARASLQASLQALWQQLDEDIPPSDRIIRQAAIRGECSLAASTALAVVQSAFELGGASSVFQQSPLQRRLRDAQVLAQHYYLSRRGLDVYGRLLLGQALTPAELAMLQR